MQKENKSLSLDQVAHLCNKTFGQIVLVRDEILDNPVQTKLQLNTHAKVLHLIISSAYIFHIILEYSIFSFSPHITCETTQLRKQHK